MEMFGNGKKLIKGRKRAMKKLLDAKVINTAYGLEVYLDSVKSIEITEVHIPTIDSPFYEAKFGIKYFLLRKEKNCNSQRNYFYIRMNPDFSSIVLKETETESLFAVKNDDERKATKKLLGEWFVKTNNYKECINEFITEVEKEDTSHTAETIKFLEKLLEVTTEDIELASVERPATCK